MSISPTRPASTRRFSPRPPRRPASCCRSRTPRSSTRSTARSSRCSSLYKGKKDDLFNQFARVYATSFTQDELQQIVTFYDSPVGKKLAELLVRHQCRHPQGDAGLYLQSGHRIRARRSAPNSRPRATSSRHRAQAAQALHEGFRHGAEALPRFPALPPPATISRARQFALAPSVSNLRPFPHGI